ncbi:MAG: ABC transporter substrate-binding protein, partial [Actinomycetota bacterium]|nr:ABC transporter substrate-binding protein [Actinomycetota bacterium]
VRYVTFVGAYQQAASLVRTMKQQGFTPDVYQPTVTAYTPEFIKQAGDAAEGTFVAVAPSLNEEMNGNPELSLYAQWLNQVEPGAVPTGIGQYAWAAASLFIDKIKKIGPHLTRQALLAQLPGERAYTGNGLFPPNDVGGRTLSDCTSVVQVKSAAFVRHTPPQIRGLRCGDGIWDSKAKRAITAGPGGH